MKPIEEQARAWRTKSVLRGVQACEHLELVIEASDPGGNRAVEPMRRCVRGGDPGVVDTVEAMKAVIDSTNDTKIVHELASLLLERAGVRVQAGVPAWAGSIFSWFKQHVTFCADPRGTEWLRHPDNVVRDAVRLGRACVDCDDQTTLGVSILKAMGVKPVIITIGRGVEFEHVYFGFVTGGRVVPLDPQETPFAGMEPEWTRRRIWEV